MPGDICFSQQLTNGNALHCIPRHEHIVFVGDSTMRYQFLTLAYALKNGVEYAGGDGHKAGSRTAVPVWMRSRYFL